MCDTQYEQIGQKDIFFSKFAKFHNYLKMWSKMG